MRRIHLAILTAAVFAAAAFSLSRRESLRAERSPTPSAGSYQQPAAAVDVPPPEASAKRGYGNTPTAAVPYKDLREPRSRFFVEDMPFRGPGREKPEPADLETVRIGFLGPIENSPDEALGQDMLRGVQLAVDEANAAGGYRGKPFELAIHNDLAIWGASSNEAVKLSYDDKVWGIIGSIDGANTHIALRVVLKSEVPMVCTGSTDPTITETRIPWLLRCCADDRQNGYALARYAFQKQGYKRPAALRANNRYGRMGIREFRDTARRMGRPLVAELRYPPGDSDFSDELSLLQRAQPDCLVVWGDGRDLGPALKQLREGGLTVPVLGTDRLKSDEFLKLAGPAAEGLIATYPYDPNRDDPVLQTFLRAFRQKFDREPTHFAAHGYDGAKLMLNAVRKAGLNRVKIRDALLGLTHYRGVTGDIPFDASWNDVGPVWLMEVRDGRFEFLGTTDEVVGADAA